MKEALVVCGDKNLTVGVTIWDIETGDHLLHIPTCASSFHGITCLRNQYLVASQIHRPGSVACGVIFTWPLSKPRASLRSYPVETIEPLSSTKDGIYLAGGATSGNVYLWEVINGKLLKTWHAHNSPLTCLAFSDDASLLISGSEDGVIVVWSMIRESITALTFSRSGLISASEDCTACLWDVVEGVIIRRFHHKKGFITNMVVIPNSSLVPSRNLQQKSTHLPVSLLQKYSQQDDPSKATVTLLSPPGEQQITHHYQSANLLNQQILDLEVERTPEALQLKLKTNIENRVWINGMAKHVTEMNEHLRLRLLDLTQHRILLEETEAKTYKNL